MAQRLFYVGDPAPWFVARSASKPNFHFDTAAGRYLVLSFFGTMTDAVSASAREFVLNDLRHYLENDRILFFGVSIDPEDESHGRVAETLPGIRYFLDFDRKVSELYGAAGPEASGGDMTAYNRFTLVLDPFLRVLANIPLTDAVKHNEQLQQVLAHLPPIDNYAGAPLSAPVLILPRVFELPFCQQLIQLYEQHGGGESGFMRDKDGKTVGMIDHSFKRRKDFNFDAGDYGDLRDAVNARFSRRVVPEIKKAFQFAVTRIERYLVACYEGDTGGFFHAHRDNTTTATAHRRFACTINLNAEDYEGGELRFPEFGMRTYRAPTGGAVVFSCSLLHEAMPVTRGRRYAFLPFLYDDAAAKVREVNIRSMSGQTAALNR